MGHTDTQIIKAVRYMKYFGEKHCFHVKASTVQTTSRTETSVPSY
jgi:hypothetical protein